MFPEKKNKRVKVSRTDPFFLLQASHLLLKFFVMHLPSTPIAFYCAGPALITHTSIICCTKYCNRHFSYLCVSHMIFLQFLQNSAAKLISELYPHSCDQTLPHHRASWNVASPCLSVPLYMSTTGLSISSLKFYIWGSFLTLYWSVFSKQIFPRAWLWWAPGKRVMMWMWHFGDTV